ncbi:MAG: phage tail tape measure protein, partial [Solirubrobacterales bacterium]
AAALARITKVAPNTEQAATSLKSLFAQLSRADVRERLASAGVIIADDTFRSATGLVDVLRQLREATGGSATGFTALIPELEAFQAASILAADDAEDFIDILGRVRSSGGAVDRALEVALSGTLVRFRRTREALKSVLAELGAAAKPVLDEIADGTRGLLDQLAGFIRRNRTEITAFLTSVRDRVVAFHDFVVAVFSTGATGEALSNAFGSAIRIGADVLVAGIPILGKAAALVGRQIARQLFESFFREGQASLFAAAEKLGAIGRLALRQAGGGEVLDLVDQLRRFENFAESSGRLGADAKQGKRVARELLRVAREEIADSGVRDELLQTLGDSAAALDAGDFAGFGRGLRAAIQKIRGELRASRGDTAPLQEALVGDIADLQAGIAAFGETVKGSLKREVDGFGSTLAPDVRKLWDQIFVDTLPQRRLERAVQALSPAVRAAFDQIVSREGIDSTERQTTLALGLLRIDQARLKVTEAVTAALTRQATAQAPDGGADPAKAFQGAEATFKRVERALDDAQRAQQAYALGLLTAEERVRRFAAAESELAIATGLVGGDLAAAAEAF